MKRKSCKPTHEGMFLVGLTQCPHCLTSLYEEDFTGPVRLCTECGARVTNINLKVTTCSNACTLAKRQGLTRQMVEKRQANNEPWQDDYIRRYSIQRQGPLNTELGEKP